MQALQSSPLAQLELDLTAAVAKPTTVCSQPSEPIRKQWRVSSYEHGKQTERMVKRMSKFINKVADEAAALLNEGDCKHEDGTPHNCHAVTVTILPFDRTKDGPQQLTIRTQRDWPEKWAFCLFCEHDVLTVEEIAARLSERCYEIFVSHPGFTLG